MLELIRKSYSSEIRDWFEVQEKNLAFAEVRPEKLAGLLKSLRYDSKVEMKYLDLFSLTLSENQFLLRYFLRSDQSGQTSLVIKSSLPFDREVIVDSAVDLWPNIAFYEQEYLVLFGIKFKGLAPSKLFSPVLLREFPYAPESATGGLE